MVLVWIVYMNGCLAYLANSFLIYCIVCFSRKEMGTYKYIMIIFASFNILYPTIHMVVLPEMHVHGRAFILFPSSVLSHMMELGHWGMVAYGSLFCGSCVLLAYHFLYRYFLLCKPYWMFIFNDRKFTLILVVIWVAMVIVWGAVLRLTMYHTEEYRNYIRDVMWKEYKVDVDETPTLGLLYVTNSSTGEEVMNIKSYTGYSINMTQLAVTFGVMVWCIVKINSKLNQCSLSPKAKKLQVDLFRALIYQTVIPLVFEYTPCAVTFNTAMLGIPLAKGCNYVPIFISFYPLLDPLCILYFVRDYRMAIRKKLNMADAVSSTAHQATMMSVTPSHTKCEQEDPKIVIKI